MPVYEAGELDGALYLIMRWVDGTDLRTLIASAGRLSPDRTVELLAPVTAALAAGHRRGLIHRDVKPANVLIADGGGDSDHVYLTDFGIARELDADTWATRTGVLVGTLDYTAPERIEGGRHWRIDQLEPWPSPARASWAGVPGSGRLYKIAF